MLPFEVGLILLLNVVLEKLLARGKLRRVSAHGVDQAQVTNRLFLHGELLGRDKSVLGSIIFLWNGLTQMRNRRVACRNKWCRFGK